MSWKQPEYASRDQRVQERQDRMNRQMRDRMHALPAGPVRAVMGGSTSGKVVAKEEMLQHLGYMSVVRKLGYCMLCTRVPRKGFLDFCHTDQGKGAGIKTDVRRGWPGCRDCHTRVGSSGQIPREHKRELEDALAFVTRSKVRALGWWPTRLADWPETTTIEVAESVVLRWRG